jgi:hypothetical protein
MAILACKLESQCVLGPMGAGENFDSRVQPTPELNLRECRCMFLFQPVGDPRPTRIWFILYFTQK